MSVFDLAAVARMPLNVVAEDQWDLKTGGGGGWITNRLKEILAELTS